MKMKQKNVLTTSLFIAAITGITFLSGCLKGDDTPTKPQFLISFLQASPDAPDMDLYFNQDKYNSNPIVYKTRGQIPKETGNYDIKLVNSSTGDTILRYQDSLKQGYYSMVVYDTGSSRDLMFFQDQFANQQNQTDMYLRFLHLSPNAGPVKVITNTQTDTAVWYNSRSFADNVGNPDLAKFNVKAEGTYSFTAISLNTGDTLGHIEDVQLSANLAYTIYLRGVSGSTVDSLGIELGAMRNY
jgi:hypothetical protein